LYQFQFRSKQRKDHAKTFIFKLKLRMQETCQMLVKGIIFPDLEKTLAKTLFCLAIAI
jgi:hypothetical protein